MKPALALSLALLFAAPPALAQDNGAWTVKGERATVTVSGISVPARAATMSLTKTAEASQKGKGLDNFAQYASEDGSILGTVYIFFSTYADTALATWATERAVRQRYGPDVTIADDRIIAVAGVPAAATRRLYDKGYFEAGKPLATAAGFVRAGSWLVGVRVTGPATRRAEVESGIDALIAGLRFDGKAKPMTAAPLNVTTCPVGTEKPAKYLDDKKASGTALFASLFGGSIDLEKDKGETEKLYALPAFPANGARPLCVRGTIINGTVRNDVLQPASPEDGQILLVPIDDAGGVVTVEPVVFSDGFVVKQYGIGFVDVLGSYRTLPSLDQIGAILGGRDKKGGAVRSSTVITPDGNSTIQVNTDTLK